ncbi:MAG: YqgE/AlgH family protein [Nitrospirae bacterium]|nr:YqgE/AlgH family protein [Nitrospirota bacterium]
MLLTVSPGILSAAEREPGTMPPIGKGVFLIASPNLMDPNFYQTVVLICEHGPEGTLGVVINRPTDIRLSEALPKLAVLKGTSYVLFSGGPVQVNGILMLFRVTEAPTDTREVLKGIYLGGNLETLERVITRPKPTETFRAYAGYAGWAPGQLEYEMAMGSWATLPADSASIFDKEPTSLWPDSLATLKGPRVIRSGAANDGATDGWPPHQFPRSPA